MEKQLRFRYVQYEAKPTVYFLSFWTIINLAFL